MELPGDYSRGPVEGYEWRKLELRTVLIPSIRCNTASALVNDKLYLIGGRGGGLFNEVWSLSLQDRLWELVQYHGDPPSPRDSHSANKVSDNSIVVFGGRGPCNSDRAERSLETQKIKCVTQREVYNDMFSFSCDERKWSPIVRKSRWPAGRRGHTATFIPPEPPEPLAKHGAKHKAKISFQDDNVSMKGLLVVFGGGSVDAAWGTEQIMNELWVYNFDTESWTNQKPRGNIPPPIYEHTAALVGEQIVFVGGIVAPHRPQQYVDPEDSFPDNKDGAAGGGTSAGEMSAQVYLNGDILALNVKTWTWSTIEVRSKLLQPVSVGLHGHSMVVDPHDSNQLIIFGGKETGDLKSFVEAKLDSKAMPAYRKNRRIRNRSLLLNLNERTLCARKTTNECPEARYGHCCVAFPLPPKPVETEPSDTYRSFFQKPSDSLSLNERGEEPAEDTEEDVLFVFGGSRANDLGFCAPDVHVLVRTVRWPDPNSVTEKRISMIFTEPINSPSEESYDGSFSNMFQSNEEITPREVVGSASRQLLMQQALAGKVTNSYDEVKHALLVSRCVREHNADNLDKFSFNKWETTSRTSRGSRNSRASRMSKRGRKTANGNGNGFRPFTAPVPGTLMGGLEAVECNQEALAEQARRQRQAKVQGLAQELPPLISGMTITQARKQYQSLHKPPTREALFGESEFGLSVYDVLQDRTLTKSIYSKKSMDPLLKSRAESSGSFFRPQIL